MTTDVVGQRQSLVGEVTGGTVSFLRRRSKEIAVPTVVFVLVPYALSSIPLLDNPGFNLALNFLALAYSALIARMVYDDACERPVGLKTASPVLQRFGSLVLLGIMSSLGIILASILLIVPGVILALWWFVATAAWTNEELTATEALGRSRALTKDYRLQLLGLLGIYLAIVLAVLVAYALAVYFAPGQNLPAPALLVFNVLAFTPMVVIAAVGPSVAYVQLRRRKEGLLADEAAAVF